MFRTKRMATERMTCGWMASHVDGQTDVACSDAGTS